MPVAEVMCGGRPTINAPSSAAAVGMSFKSMAGNLRCCTGSEITAAMVTSEPVPAVVGTAYNGNMPQKTRNKPAIFTTGLLFLARAPMILAASMEEPPPTAMIASQPSAASN